MSRTYKIQFVKLHPRPQLFVEVFHAQDLDDAKRQSIVIMRNYHVRGGRLLLRIAPVGNAPEFWSEIGRVNAKCRRELE